MSPTTSDRGENVSFMSREPVELSPLSPTDSRIIIERFSAVINGSADEPAEAINKLFPTASDRTSNKLIYDPTDSTIAPEGSIQRRKLKNYCGDGVDPFGTKYKDQDVPGVLGPVYTVPTVHPSMGPLITPTTESVVQEVVTTTTTQSVLPGSPPPSPPRTPTPPLTPPLTPPITAPPVSLPETPPAVSPPVSPPISPPLSTLASSTSTTSARKVSPPLSSPVYSPPIVTSPPLSLIDSPPISPLVVSPPTPPGVKVAQTSYFPPVSP
jgi:hypothetical protein